MEYILGIETSCDDSCVSVVDLDFNIIFEKSIHQVDIHSKYGGVVPELASRAHLQYLQILLKEVRQYVNFDKIAAICPTYTPGLIGGLLTGVVTAKGIAKTYNKKLIGIHHLQGHLESVNIGRDRHVEYPSLTLLVSGGHCQFIISYAFGKYEIIGQTLDDSIGEAFDKCGKMMGMNYPAGPEIEKMALNGSDITEIGKPMYGDNLNFSMSGFKTNFRNFLAKNPIQNEQDIANLSFTIQKRICDNIIFKTELAIKFARDRLPNLANFTLCGGVAANKYIIKELEKLCSAHNLCIHYPKLKYATDNATMIAFAGVKKYKNNDFSEITLSPKSRYGL